MVMHMAKNSEFAVLCHVAESNPLHCTCHQVLRSGQQSLCAYLHTVICINLDVCCSTPQGYVNSNAVLWPDIDYIGLLSSHFICTAFTSILKKASRALQNAEASFKCCNLAFKNNLSKCTIKVQSCICMFRVCT